MLVLAVLHMVVCLTSTAHSQLDPQWTTDPSRFLRRGSHSSILLGKHIYMDGGEIFWQENGTNYNTLYNSTYSLPVSESWDPASVLLTRIDKGNATVFNRPNLWPSGDDQSFFSFNGELSQIVNYSVTGDPPGSAQLWQFVSDGKGSGQWQLFSVAPETVTQSVAGVVAIAKGSAFLLGGYQSWRTTLKMYDDTSNIASADGLLVYSMDARDWINETMKPFTPTGWWYEGQLSHLVGFGNDDLLLAMGGVTALPLDTLSGEQPRPYDTVSIYNTATSEWRNQLTTGDIPDARRIGSCYVGVAGDNGTYEIFLHGGRIGATTSVQSQININLDQVYVLSIPSFSWHKTSYTPTDPRALHTCQVAGNRQMIAVGGVPPDLSLQYFTADPWPQGLGIFDLTEMVWKHSYDADAAPYETPNQIKDYIATNGPYPQEWDDDVMERWITGRVSSTGPSPASPSPSDEGAKGGGGSNTGAIVGGVVGSVGGALLIALLAWFLIRRRNKAKREPKTSKEQSEEQVYEKAELDGKYGLSPDTPWLSSDHKGGAELHDQPIHEMAGTHAEHELAAERRMRYEMPGR